MMMMVVCLSCGYGAWKSVGFGRYLLGIYGYGWSFGSGMMDGIGNK